MLDGDNGKSFGGGGGGESILGPGFGPVFKLISGPGCRSGSLSHLYLAI